MSSVVHYKFKSQRDASRVVFDGTALSVYDLKREIMVQNKMGKGVDFDIALYNAQTEEGESRPPPDCARPRAELTVSLSLLCVDAQSIETTIISSLDLPRFL